MQVFKTLGRKPAQLENLPVPPEGMQYLWDYYKEVFTGEPITYLEMEAWVKLTRRHLEPWEVKAIKALDKTFWKVQRG